MKQSESISKLAVALVAAQSDLRAIGKDSVNPHFKNRYASLDSIVETVRPILAKHGLAVVQGVTLPETNEHGALLHFAVETVLIHASGEWLSNAAILPLAKSDPQGAGGALTYGRRYGLSALLSLATEDDDDGNTASRPAARTEPAKVTETRGAMNGSNAVWPFGKRKGTPLSKLTETELQDGITWATEKDAKKFADLIANCRDELASRETDEIPY